ncbi:hypothetical protein KBI23_18585 [bacterium]|nr:hypothetical protein [bacterium]
MHSANTLTLVLSSYAEASKRADASMNATRDALEAPLIAAREALRHAKATTLQELVITCEKAYLAAHKTYENEYRLAGSNHGLAITRALTALDQRKLVIDAERVARLSQAQARYQQVCADAGSPDHISCLPAFDALKLEEVEADEVRDEQLRGSNEIYLGDKREQDIIYADRLVAIERQKRDSLDQTKQVFDLAVSDLIPPLEAALGSAQAAFNQQIYTATTHFNQTRQRRLSIYDGFQNGNSTAAQAVRWLDQLD